MDNVHVNLRALEENAEYFAATGKVSGLNQIAWALKALQLTDLTTLAGDDTLSNVHRLCLRAAYPFTEKEIGFLGPELAAKIHTAAVCVYPSRVADAKSSLDGIDIGQNIQIAAGLLSDCFEEIFK